jgi:peptide/nickel transport system permease protein
MDSAVIGASLKTGFRRRVTPGSTSWYFVRSRSGMISLVIVICAVFAAILAPFLTPYAAQGEGSPNVALAFHPPSWAHPFGTDDLGRDELARVLFGARPSLLLGFFVVLIGVTVGSALGVIAGYSGGWLDEVIMRLTDVVLSFPPLLLAIALAAALGPSLTTAIIAISATWWPWYTRLVRAETVSVRERNYVLAAQALGGRRAWVIIRHVVPNVLGPVRVQATFDLGAAILTGAGLSFLGLGPQPPTADWGAMVLSGGQYLEAGAWWLTIFPGLAIFVVVVAFNLLGDAFHAAADPRAREL